MCYVLGSQWSWWWLGCSLAMYLYHRPFFSLFRPTAPRTCDCNVLHCVHTHATLSYVHSVHTYAAHR